MSYHLSGTATTAIVKAPSGKFNPFLLRVQAQRGNFPALQKVLVSLKTERASCSKCGADNACMSKCALIDEALRACSIEIVKATRKSSTTTPVPGPFVPPPGGSTTVVESPTASITPEGQIVPGPGAQIVVTPEVGPSSGAEVVPQEVTVSSGSLGTIVFVGGLIGLAYLMLRKRGAA